MKTTHHKNLILKLFMLFGLMLCLSFYSFSYIMGNDSENAFPPDGSGSSNDIVNIKTASSIKLYIIESASYFLNSYSKYIQLMNKIEMSGLYSIDFEEWDSIANKSVIDMENAVITYSRLKYLADNTPYNQIVIDELKKFDYANFQVKNDFNRDIFADVEFYLKAGDVRGVYSQLLKDSQSLFYRLFFLKIIIDNNIFPNLTELCKTNQSFSKTILFGQYVSEVFRNIMEKI